MSGTAIARLVEERKQWRKDHPFGFTAKPDKLNDGTFNLLKWNCVVPGKQGTIWEGGFYPVVVHFPNDYPLSAPKCSFDRGFFHPNVFADGAICLSLLDEYKDWKASISMKSLLLGVQELLDNPNCSDPAQHHAYQCYKHDIAQYERRVRSQAQQYGEKKE